DQQKKIEETQVMLDEGIQEIRKIIRDLVPRHIEEHGLMGALEDLKQHFEKVSRVNIQIACNPGLERFQLQSEINIYRMVQEMVNNAIKHAQANSIDIIIHHDADTLTVCV